MVTPSVTNADKLKAVRAVEEHGNISAAARYLGMDRTTLRRHYRLGLEDGLQLSEGAQTAIRGAGLSGMEAKRGWRVVADKATGSRDSTYWEAPQESAEDIAERIREAFDSITPCAPVLIKEDTSENRLALLPHADVHIGMVTSVDQSGRDYNRKIAVERLTEGMARCLYSQQPSHRAIILNAGDLTHANDDSDETKKSRHKLKVEGTHHQNIDISIQATITLIDMALGKHGAVHYRGIPGNHDPNTPDYLGFALRAYYRNEPRVEIEIRENAWWQYNFGITFLSSQHGDKRNAKEICNALPAKYPVEWGEAKEWFYISGHKHNYQRMNYGSVTHIQLPSVCSLDPYAYDSAFGANAALQAMMIHREAGLTDDLSFKL